MSQVFLSEHQHNVTGTQGYQQPQYKYAERGKDKNGRVLNNKRQLILKLRRQILLIVAIGALIGDILIIIDRSIIQGRHDITLSHIMPAVNVGIICMLLFNRLTVPIYFLTIHGLISVWMGVYQQGGPTTGGSSLPAVVFCFGWIHPLLWDSLPPKILINVLAAAAFPFWFFYDLYVTPLVPQNPVSDWVTLTMVIFIGFQIFVASYVLFNSFSTLSDGIQLALDDALRAQAAQAAFLAKMSHEVRTPLTGIVGLQELLLGTTMTGEQRRWCQAMSSAAKILSTVINDMLDFSKLEAGYCQLISESTNLVNMVESTFEIFKGIQQQKDLSGGVTFQTEAPIYVLMDGMRVQQMLCNLLSNAFKFTDEGSVSVHVSYDLDRCEMCIKVVDTGIGVPESQRAKLFQQFSQVDETINRRYGGTGLGLSIVKLLANAMGGTTGMDANPGGGSSFWFTVYAPVAATGLRDSFTTLEDPSDSIQYIMVVDDTEVNLTIMKEKLIRLNKQVKTFNCGQKAIDFIKRNPGSPFLQLVLMDLWMPDVDGIQATQAIMAMECRNAYIVGCTADVTPEARQQALSAGMRDIILKPVTQTELLRVFKAAKEASPVNQDLPLGTIEASPSSSPDIDISDQGSLARVYPIN